MATPRLNTLEKDIEDFQKERQKFLDTQEKFKAGYAAYGITALNLVTSMYHILLASYHYPLSKQEKKTSISPADFLKSIQALKEEITLFVKSHQEGQPTDGIGINFYGLQKFKELEASFDAIVQNFYVIKSECGLT